MDILNYLDPPQILIFDFREHFLKANNIFFLFSRVDLTKREQT